jgi:hypothetical protein
MSKFLIAFLVVCVSFGFTSSGQDSGEVNHYDRLKSGVLLVRLHTDMYAIKKLREVGKYDEAEELAISIHDQNMKLLQAFRTHYDYGRVEFFYSLHSEKVKSRDYEGILLDDKLAPDAAISVDNESPVYVLDAGDVYVPAFGQHFRGMVVMDDDMVALEKPFPAIVRERSGMAIIKRTEAEMVMKLMHRIKKHEQLSKL